MPIEEYRERVKNEKRAVAIEAALSAFLEQGYDRTTLQQVASAAGISTGTLFKHFPTKAELFGAIMEQFWEVDPDLERSPTPTGDPAAGLLAIGFDYARLLLRPQTEQMFRIIIAETQRFPELGRALFERGKGPYIRRLQDYLQAEVTAGTLVVDDVPLTARQLLGMINDVIFWPKLLLTDMAVGTDEVDHVVREAVKTIIARCGVSKQSQVRTNL